jgi:hypothetical protein
MSGPERVTPATPRTCAAIRRRAGTAMRASPPTTRRAPASTTNPKKRTVRPKETPTAITPRRPTSSLSSVTAGAWTGHRGHNRRRHGRTSRACSTPAAGREGCAVPARVEPPIAVSPNCRTGALGIRSGPEAGRGAHAPGSMSGIPTAAVAPRRGGGHRPGLHRSLLFRHAEDPACRDRRRHYRAACQPHTAPVTGRSSDVAKASPAPG